MTMQPFTISAGSAMSPSRTTSWYHCAKSWLRAVMRDSAINYVNALLVFKICNQHRHLVIVHSLHEGGHDRPAVLNPYQDVSAIRRALRERQPGVLEQVMQAGADLAGAFLILVDVVTDRTILAEQVLAEKETCLRFFPWRRRFFGGEGRGGRQQKTQHALHDSTMLSAPALWRHSVAVAARPASQQTRT